MSSLYGNNKDEFIVSLAALALYDGSAEITSENITALIAASGNEVAPYWPSLFSGFLADNAEKLVFSLGAPAAAGAAAAAPAGGAAEAAAPVEEKKEKVEEVDALDGGMGLFGGAAY